MTQPGETDGYSVSEHIKGIFDHTGAKVFNYCLVNNKSAPHEALRRYIEDGAGPINEDEEKVRELGVEMISAPTTINDSDLVRHDSSKLTNEIMRVFNEKAPTKLFGAPR